MSLNNHAVNRVLVLCNIGYHLRNRVFYHQNKLTDIVINKGNIKYCSAN